MPWFKVEMSWDDISAEKHIALWHACRALFAAAGSPNDAAVFDNAGIHQNVSYFSPRAVEICKSLILRYGGVECPAPTKTSVHLAVGSQSGTETIQFSPEPDLAEDDDD
jgi:hypothetical protein